MPSKSRARRGARPASLPTTMVSRKLTKAATKERPAKKSRVVTKSTKKPKIMHATWLKPQECIPILDLSPRPLGEWLDWFSTRPNFSSSAASDAWAAETIVWAEKLTSTKSGEAAPQAETALRADLLEITEEAGAIPLEVNPLSQQLLRGELRVKLGVATSDAALAQAGLLSIIEALEALLDGEGAPHKKYLSVFPELVACWLRSIRLVTRKKLHEIPLNEQQSEALAQCKWLGLRLAQLSRADGTPIFSRAGSTTIKASLLLDAITFWCDAKARRDAACLRHDVVKPVPKPAVEKLPRGTANDWSGVAIFRTEATPDAGYLAVAYNDAECLMEIGSRAMPWVSGDAKLRLTRDGHPLAPTGVWEEVCRNQEPNVEYWELERTYDRGVWLQRQVVIACKDQFAYVCDNIVADSAGDLTYQLDLPLAPEVLAKPAAETREVVLQRGNSQATILPLAAEEWRTTPSYFDLRVEGNSLRFTGETKKQRMAIAWMMDLRGGKKLEEVTWRQLRVAENLENLPRDIAVAFRWQFGTSHWMAYRSLAAPSNRTILGQNLIGDFFLARLMVDGKTKTIVEIE
jgi:hypothetical protein